MKNNYTIGLTIFRVIICLLIIKNCSYYLGMADDLFGLNAIYPIMAYKELMVYYGIEIFTYPFSIPYAPQFFLITMIILASLYMVAIGGRFTGIALYLMVIILKIRNGFILDGSDNVIQVTLPFLVLADSLDHFRLFDRKVKDKSDWQLLLSKYGHIGILIQVSFVYFFTGLAKIQGELWLNGTATYYTMRVRDFMATDYNILLTKSHYFVVLTTYFTLFWELAFPFLVWFRKTKLYIILGGVLLHFGIWIFMRIDNFSWVMIATYFLFFSNSEYQMLSQRRLTVFIDNWCPNCLKFSKFIKRIDILNLINFKGLRQIDNFSQFNISKDKALKEMASIDVLTNKSYYGFESIYNIFLRIPFLWLFLPCLWLLEKSGIGDILYLEIAIKRKVIPLHCDSDCLIKKN